MKLSKFTTLLVLMLSVKGWSQNIQLVSLKQLREKQIDDQTISRLKSSEYLIPTSSPDFYFLNTVKINTTLTKNLDIENHEFLSWMKFHIKPEIKVQLKNPKDMFLGTQDIHGGAKDKTKGN